MLLRGCFLVVTCLLLTIHYARAEEMAHLWSQRFGDVASQAATSVAVDGSGHVVIVGDFYSTVDFGGGLLVSGGSTDIFVARFDPTGDHTWSQRFGDTDIQYGLAVTTDSSGNVIVTGRFGGTVDFGGGPLSSNPPGSDIFIAKFSPNGAHLWSQSFGDTNNQWTRSVAADGAGNVIVTGGFGGTVNFGGGPLSSGGSSDIFVAKFGSNGTHIWSQSFGDSSWQEARSVAVDGTGNVIITGGFGGTVNFGGGPLSSGGASDVFAAKFGPSGTHIWSQNFGDTNDQLGTSVAVDGTEKVIITGAFWGTVDFGGGPLSSGGSTDIFVAKFGPNGTHIWSQSFGSTDDQWTTGVAVDDSGNVVIAGSFRNIVDFGGGLLVSAGLLDIFVAKFDRNGNHTWSQRYGDTNDQYIHAVAVEEFLGDVVITGEFEGAVDFGGDPLPSAGNRDVFVARFGPKKPFFLVYLNGDNDLDAASFDDFNELETAAASNDSIRIGVCWDRLGSGNSAYYLVQPDTNPLVLANYIEGINKWSMGELDMGDPSTLTDFTRGALTEFPTSKICLVIWNHGSGWGPVLGPHGPLGISWDWTNGSNFFTTAELCGAIGTIRSQLQRNLDILGLDACLMAMTEIAYDFRNDVDFVVGSEELEPADGWEYDILVPNFHPSTSSDTLCREIVQSYPGATLSAFRCGTSMDLLATRVDELAVALLANLSAEHANIWAARTDPSLVTFDYDVDGNENQDSYVDLAHLCQLLSDTCSSSAIIDAAMSVIIALDAARVDITHHGSYYAPAGGLSIYFPDHQPDIVGGDDYFENYLNIGANPANLELVISTHWDEFLVSLLACQVQPTALDFGRIWVNDSLDTTFTIANTGINILSANVSETHDHYEIVSGGGQHSLAPGESLMVTVQFCPTASGLHDCTIDLGDSLCCNVQCAGIAEAATGIGITQRSEFTLHQNHPNPFNPTTTISFVLPERKTATLVIYDVEGRHVKTLVDNVLDAGLKEVTWDGEDALGNQVSTGVYFYRLTAGNRTLTKKMVLLK
ncbi:MAG: T9SS type A sorting domain-containing protein [Candidatus Latescibacterota bacterium]|nr:MAG: T9SS type A sorting domain-containing protein [Candidatus Latescibacterota bacterium]